jgi:hypothetical protein
MREKCSTWAIVAFDHPDTASSMVFKWGLNEDAMMLEMREAMKNGANLFSIRGFRNKEKAEKK